MTVQAISRWTEPERSIALATRGLILRTIPGLTEAVAHGSVTFRKQGKPVLALAVNRKAVDVRIIGTTTLFDPFKLTHKDRGDLVMTLTSSADVVSPGLMWILTSVRAQCLQSSSSSIAMAR